jgi:hypothetical protein
LLEEKDEPRGNEEGLSRSLSEEEEEEGEAALAATDRDTMRGHWTPTSPAPVRQKVEVRPPSSLKGATSLSLDPPLPLEYPPCPSLSSCFGMSYWLLVCALR